MGRPPKTDRATVHTETLTLRLTPGDRDTLTRLVALRQSELAADGASVTIASLVRALILREAQTRGVASGAVRLRKGT